MPGTVRRARAGYGARLARARRNSSPVTRQCEADHRTLPSISTRTWGDSWRTTSLAATACDSGRDDRTLIRWTAVASPVLEERGEFVVGLGAGSASGTVLEQDDRMLMGRLEERLELFQRLEGGKHAFGWGQVHKCKGPEVRSRTRSSMPHQRPYCLLMRPRWTTLPRGVGYDLLIAPADGAAILKEEVPFERRST